MYKNAGYDVRKDFAPIGLIAVSPSLVLANKDVPVKNIQELIAHIKKSGEPFQYGSPGVGTVNHLAAEMFARAAKVKLMAIPYKGSNGLNTDLIAGHVKIGFNPIPVSRGAIESRTHPRAGRDHREAVEPVAGRTDAGGARACRFRRLAALRTVAPAGTPPAIVERLNKALNAALADEAVIKRIRHEGAEPTPITPAQYAADIDKEEIRWSAVVKELGLVGK